jgi:hypothetical protein
MTQIIYDSPHIQGLLGHIKIDNPFKTNSNVLLLNLDKKTISPCDNFLFKIFLCEEIKTIHLNVTEGTFLIIEYYGN